MVSGNLRHGAAIAKAPAKANISNLEENNIQLRHFESRAVRQMLKSPKIMTALKAAGEPIASAVVVAAIVAVALAAGAALRPHKRVGVDWENRQFMLRGEEQGPIVKEAPHGPAWYVPPHERRI